LCWFVLALLSACVLTCVLVAPIASAEPDAEPVAAEAQPAEVAPPPPHAAPVDDGRVESSPPKTMHSPDGWTLTMSARD
jgi:hypothetical protein